jgi:hypothetical protein
VSRACDAKGSKKNKSVPFSLFANIAELWHYEKNGVLKPDNVTPKSNKRVWWQCKKGHEWENKINNQVKHGKKYCPYCDHHLASDTYNLAVCYPKVAAQWHPNKNNDENPSNFLPKSNKKVWWLCEYGHEWEMTINSRTSGTGCPYCAGKLGRKIKRRS